MPRPRLLSFPFVVLLCSVLLPALGCGDGKEPTGTVTGVVTTEGEAVEMGTVAFECGENGVIRICHLGDGGQYKVEGLKYGEYTISVLPPEQDVPNELGDFDGSKSIEQRKIKIPKNIPSKYTQPHTSPLRFTVSQSTAEHPIELAP